MLDSATSGKTPCAGWAATRPTMLSAPGSARIVSTSIVADSTSANCTFHRIPAPTLEMLNISKAFVVPPPSTM